MESPKRTELGTDHLKDRPDSHPNYMSVSDLVRRRLDPSEEWKLALVQRHRVWDGLRMKRLLDSLIAGYPIGTLLVCKLRQESITLRETKDTRIAEASPAGSWQLLDGQQRINALACIFTKNGDLGPFLVNMFNERITEDVVTRTRDKRKATEYIFGPDEPGDGASEPPRRERYLDLSCWYDWAARSDDGRLSNILVELEKSDAIDLCLKILNEIDPAFKDAVESGMAARMIDRTRRLLSAWLERRIPVQHITLDTPSDVLQVFTRANLEGVRLDGEDVFFAAIKTIWPDAEENLDRVARSTSLISRPTALRLLARLASRGTSAHDLQPLRVDRLNGLKGDWIRSAMRQMAREGSEVLARVGILGRLLSSEGRLGYGLHGVSSGLLDHAFGWAAINPEASNEGYLREQIPAIEAYFVGATAFRYATVFRDAFAQLGLEQALEAGRNGEPFPVHLIAKACREKWYGLKNGRNIIERDDDEDGHLSLANRNKELFLSAMQAIPYRLPKREGGGYEGVAQEIEWDHIYPQALARKMRAEDGRSRSYHQDRKYVWGAGNLWALDKLLNNKARDLWPSDKFTLLESLPKESLPPRWPPAQNSFLSDTEKDLLFGAEELIRTGKIESGMESFRRFVRERGLRLYEEVFRLFPEARLFARGEDGEHVPYEGPKQEPLAKELGLTDLVSEAVTSDVTAVTWPSPRFEPVIAHSEERATAQELRMIIEAVQKLGLNVRPYTQSIMITPKKKRTRMLFTLRSSRKYGGSFVIYRENDAVHELLPLISKEQAAVLGPDGWGVLTRDEVPGFIAKLEQIFSGRVE